MELRGDESRFSKRRLSGPFPVLVLVLIVVSLVVLPHRLTVRHTAPTTPVPAGPPGDWYLIFDDEFDSTLLDTTRWNTCLWWGCTGSNGQMNMCYLPLNDVVGGGYLTLRAVRQTGVCRGGSSYIYASGEIQSGPSDYLASDAKFSMLYGYIEARVKVAKGAGFLSGFWMAPVNQQLPAEVDIFEIKGANPSATDMTAHWTVNGTNYQDDSVYIGPDYSVGWHVFGVDWAPDHLTWYIDGVAWKTVANTIEVPNLAMDIQAGLDVGGSWIGSPDAATRWPGQFQIDYIRAWQRSVPQPP